ncbi:MAG TPA: c-type cytochrome domain-containing protein, partial [Planctomycetaceae bacterium]|nr:c-type cytochrome domain-containing protein [Planctomycetaceae bacterium]
MLSHLCRWRILLLALAVLAAARTENRVVAAGKTAEPVPADHAHQMAEGLALFTQHVRPVLIKRCLKCHGGEAEVQSGFNLSTREGLLAGGTNGKAIVPGKSQVSRLYRMITHAEEPNMPQDAPKLADADIAHIAAWIDRGAPYDDALVAPAKRAPVWTEKTVDPKFRQFWSFQPLKVRPAPDAAKSSP